PPTLPDEQTILNFTMQIGGTPEGLERVTAQLQSVAQEAAHYFKQLHALVPDLKLPELQEGP
ncbi:hypothetical protein ACI4BE_30255, partial [Klebsiella pneumoniae]|uniref:hypothetical protein n=1 Tax=Klebsiella pneumoniae TaxID=573 RepID=UPI0038530535